MGSFNTTCFGLVTWEILAIDSGNTGSGQLAGMRIEYNFPDLGLPIQCALLQCFNTGSDNRTFTICQVGDATNTGITIDVNRTDMIEDWSAPSQFYLSYFFAF